MNLLLIRSLLFYLGMGVLTIIIVPFCILVLPLPFKTRYYVVTRWAVCNLWWLRVTCNIRHSIQGLDNIPKSVAIVMCKHQSAWETLVLQLIFPSQVWVLKQELLRIPIYGWGLATMQPIAIDRYSKTRALRQIVRQGCKRLKQGLWVIIFPEGQRVMPNEKSPYLPGGGMLAKKSECLVVPVAHNAGYFWRYQDFIKKPGTIILVIGEAIEPKGKTASQITKEVEAWIEDKMQQLPVPEHSVQ